MKSTLPKIVGTTVAALTFSLSAFAQRSGDGPGNNDIVDTSAPIEDLLAKYNCSLVVKKPIYFNAGKIQAAAGDVILRAKEIKNEVRRLAAGRIISLKKPASPILEGGVINTDDISISRIAIRQIDQSVFHPKTYETGHILSRSIEDLEASSNDSFSILCSKKKAIDF